MIWSKCPKRVYVVKAVLLFLFVNEMNEGEHVRKSFLESLKVKCGPNVIAKKKTVYDYQMQSAKLQKNTRNADKCYVH